LSENKGRKDGGDNGESKERLRCDVGRSVERGQTQKRWWWWWMDCLGEEMDGNEGQIKCRNRKEMGKGKYLPAMGNWLPIALLRCAKIKNWTKQAGQKTTGPGGREKSTDTEEREYEREKEHTPYARPQRNQAEANLEYDTVR